MPEPSYGLYLNFKSLAGRCEDLLISWAPRKFLCVLKLPPTKWDNADDCVLLTEVLMVKLIQPFSCWSNCFPSTSISNDSLQETARGCLYGWVTGQLGHRSRTGQQVGGGDAWEPWSHPGKMEPWETRAAKSELSSASSCDKIEPSQIKPVISYWPGLDRSEVSPKKTGQWPKSLGKDVEQPSSTINKCKSKGDVTSHLLPQLSSHTHAKDSVGEHVKTLEPWCILSC